MSEDKYSCPNCETEHDTKEEATECCQCWSCVELNATINELEAKLTRITEIIGMEDGGRINNIQILKNSATRQLRHNDDNSPDIFNPRDGFVFAYDKEVIDKGLGELQNTIDAYDRIVELMEGD